MTNPSSAFQSKSDAALFVDPTSLRYLTGLRFSAGAALVGKFGKALLVDGRYYFKARRVLSRGWNVLKLAPGAAELVRHIRNLGVRQVYVDTESISAARYRKLVESADGLAVAGAEGLSDRIRAVKRPEEIRAIRDAVRLTDDLWSRVRTHIRVGMTERELRAFIIEQAIRMGAEEMSFEPIVVSGPATAEPHAEAGDRPIRGDEPLMVDMGVRLNGYCSDFTRTPFLLRRRAAPPAWFVRFYREVLAIQNLAYRLIAGGERAPGAVAKKISARLQKRRLKTYYLHSLGHGVGLKIHEEPYLTEKGRTLENGMVFTVEPGLYRAGSGGVRIEDMACLLQGRLDVLTRSTKEMVWRIS